MLCIGVFEDECPDYYTLEGVIIDGIEIPKVSLPNPKAEQPFNFELDNIVNATYGLGAMLLQSEDAVDCDQPLSGDLVSCNNIIVENGEDILGEEIILDFQIP